MTGFGPLVISLSQRASPEKHIAYLVQTRGMKKIFTRFARFSRERAIGNTDNAWVGCQLFFPHIAQKGDLRVANRALCLTLKV
jgi:hypothetical protein